MKNVSAFVLILLLCSVWIALLTIPTVKAEGTIYIRANGSIEGTDRIQRIGNVYAFLGNISIDVSGVDGIIVEKDDIVINGAGYCLEHLEKPTAMTSEDGIVVHSQNNITITNLTVHNFLYGISLGASSNVTITKTAITNNNGGIWLLGSHNNSIIDNQIVENNNGIELHYSENNIVDLNNVSANSPTGINMVNASKNIVSNNYISNNGWGIYINYGGENQIFGNAITDNKGWGIIISSSNKSLNNNVIYHNNFINNQENEGLQVANQWYFGAESNKWDNGKEGNYWSDYTTRYPNATEVDDSGIGNTHFFINEYNIDHYPLMEPNQVIPEFSSWIILPLFFMVSIFALIIRKKDFSFVLKNHHTYHSVPSGEI